MHEEPNNKESNFAEANVEDLPVNEEQAEETKGAGAPQGRLYVATDVGVYVS